MRNRLLILIIALGIFSLGLFIILENNSKITFTVEKDMINIGKVKKNDKSEAVFRIKNTGKKDIIIKNVLSDCHCTIPDWSSEPILQGETYVLNVTYDNHKLGFFEQTVSIYIKDTDIVPLLIMRGTVVE
ncbi:hypothetical protein KCTC32516_00393 [Polaribacter huanghezhanensis]|uniref:DUF1573 domain-containing protein n=1 Tax=Polaribacter huanghezhanensis TaxID=1354726 RepID=UPI0026491548|nr:DUF1573 domain-containing protein [Polaribacter huanghezhanensis]WKD85055.1 hypothetical protein KCTC32516_00393 [Polaribacter huanghezhanensis]